MKQRPFCDQRPSMRTNVLLQRSKVGAAAATTRDLPPEEFAYTPQHHDGYGAREIFAEWEASGRPQTEPSARRRVGARQDYVATNRAALHSGCISAREFRDFRKKHEILVRPEENYDAEDEEFNRAVRRDTVHGKPTPAKSEIRDILTWQGGRDAVDRARDRQTTRSLDTGARLTRGIGTIRQTRASRGHTVKPLPPPTLAETFKMKRFLAIDRYAIDDTWN
jgi:hypothetical protein